VSHKRWVLLVVCTHDAASFGDQCRESGTTAAAVPPEPECAGR
jgi:hypothetical protein